ncbi:MAG: DUF2336 domain-containing protein [Kiloniellales bacterium]
MVLQFEDPCLLEGKSENARVRIACHVGESLSLDDLPAAERLAAEALARCLVEDAIEQVRLALSKAVRHAKHLPGDIALKIAHDVDSVACPFLETTEVFSESEWQQLVLTISQNALVAVARRASMSEGLALAISEVGDSAVAEVLVENPAAPMTPAACHALIERFGDSIGVLDKLAQRDGLAAEIAITLYSNVSEAARKKLAQAYKLVDYTDLIAGEAEQAAVFELIRKAPVSQLPAISQCLQRDGKLSHLFLLDALRAGLVTFFGVALSVSTTVRSESIQSTIQHGGSASVIQLLREAGIPRPVHDAFWDALQSARSILESSEHNPSV